MFQFSRFPPHTYVFSIRSYGFPYEVPPFGNLRIKGYLLLPAAYRSLSRPSSAPGAKAFPLCSYQLGLLLKSSNLVLKFVASLHANRKSFEVFPLPFTFVMIPSLESTTCFTERPSIISISLKIFLFLSYTLFSRIRFDLLSSIHFSMFFSVLKYRSTQYIFPILYSSIFKINMVGSSGFEPPTSRLSGARSNHLSYEPIWWR